MSAVTGRHTRRIAGALGLALVGSLLAGCGSEDDGAETIRFTFNKREAIPHMRQVVDEYNASQDDVRVELDTSGPEVVSASFVRGDPPDLLLVNYNNEMARFVDRCALSDLGGTQAAGRIRADLQPLMDQYGRCEDRTSALPYSVMAASVIYNKKIFAEHDLDVPRTWSELVEVSETLQQKGVTPFYGTYKDDWTVAQGLFDYAVGGRVDILDFYEELEAEGAGVGPGSAVSFAQDFTKPLEQVRKLDEYTNDDAPSRSYADGNLAFAQEKAAMYLSGPWAFSEIAKTAPDLELGTFPLPMTEDPADLKVRLNVDLAAIVPEAAEHPEAARDFLEYLYRPEIIRPYNESQLGYTPTTDAPPPSDPRLAGMTEYYDDGRVYQGASILVPKTIPTNSYAQGIALGDDVGATMRTLDADWARLAMRQ